MRINSNRVFISFYEELLRKKFNYIQNVVTEVRKLKRLLHFERDGSKYIIVSVTDFTSYNTLTINKEMIRFGSRY